MPKYVSGYGGNENLSSTLDRYNKFRDNKRFFKRGSRFDTGFNIDVGDMDFDEKFRQMEEDFNKKFKDLMWSELRKVKDSVKEKPIKTKKNKGKNNESIHNTGHW